ncbi:MAG: OsmC family protein [Deltaproteobacteria bacterium]|nr:OsmC family protein [Deltaproteobacteria bacterium]
MAIAPFPHHYPVSLTSEGALTAADCPSIASGPPRQFGGSGREWSPEELLVGAVVACLKTTFDAYAARGTLAVRAWSATADGVLEKSRTGPVFTTIRLHVDLAVDAGEEARAEETLRRAERDCIISNALKAPIELTIAIKSAAAATNETRGET